MYIYELLISNGGKPTREGLLNVAAYLLALVFALTLHELAHGLVALWNGDPTAKAYGRLTLNPTKHFDLMGFLMLVLVGFGWAKPVPVNPNNFKNKLRGAITVSIAGISVNLFLAFLFALPFVLLGQLPLQMETARYYIVYFLYFFCGNMLVLNVSFALFNLLPLYPLDGFRLLSCFVPHDNGVMRFLRKYSLYIMLGLLILNYLPIVSAFSPLQLYIGTVGGYIRSGFVAFWRLFF